MGMKKMAASLLQLIPRVSKHETSGVRGRAISRNAPAVYEVELDADEGNVILISINGERLREALDNLIAAGVRGCPSLSQPPLRWSSYVHDLRRRGLPVQTIMEERGGQFPCRVGRYVLRCNVRRIR